MLFSRPTTIFAAVLGLVPALLWAQEEATETTVENEIPEELGEMFPIGRTFFGVKIPNYDGDTLTSIIRAAKMRRLDDENLNMEELHITTYEDKGEPATNIEMETAVYNKTDETLVSESPTRIWQKEYELKGDYMIYDRKTGNVIMKRSPERQVEMTIYGTGSLIPTTEKEEPEETRLSSLDNSGS